MSVHTMNYYNDLIFIQQLLNHNLERSFQMPNKQIKQPFQYEKIPLDLKIKKRDKNDTDKSVHTFQTVKRIWSYLAREKWKLTLVVLMVVLSSAMSLLGPFLVGKAVDDFIKVKESTGLLTLLFGLLIVYFILYLSDFFLNYCMYGN